MKNINPLVYDAMSVLNGREADETKDGECGNVCSRHLSPSYASDAYLFVVGCARGADLFGHLVQMVWTKWTTNLCGPNRIGI